MRRLPRVFAPCCRNKPDYAKALFNLAKVATVLGQWESATTCFVMHYGCFRTMRKSMSIME